MNEKNKISPFQATAIVTGTMVGVGILTLPGLAARAAGPGGWVAVLLGGAAAAVPLAILTALGQRFAAADLIQFSDNILGRILGKLIAAVFVLYWIVITGLVVRFFGAVVVTSILFRTPVEVAILVVLLLAAYLVQFDVKVFARVQEIFLPFYLLALLPLPFVAAQQLHLLHLLPIGSFGPAGFLRGIAASAGAYLGFEVVTMFQPYYVEPRKAYRVHFLGLAIVTLIYTGVTAFTIGVFSAEGVTQMQWPSLELIKVSRLPGLLFERSDAAFIAFWLIAAFTTIASFYYSAARAIAHLVGLQSQAKLALPLLPLIYYLAMLPRNLTVLEQYVSISTNIGGIIILTVPLLLLAAAIIRRKGGKAHAHG